MEKDLNYFEDRADRYANLNSLKSRNLSKIIYYRDYEIDIERLVNNKRVDDGIYVFLTEPQSEVMKFHKYFNKTESFKFIEMEIKDDIDMMLANEFEKDF